MGSSDTNEIFQELVDFYDLDERTSSVICTVTFIKLVKLVVKYVFYKKSILK